MSTKITIGSTVITFPTSGTDANWAEAVDEFALAVETQLAGLSSTYDVSPTVIPIADNSTTPLLAATFSTASVRSFVLTYSIYRTSTAQTIVESGTFSAVNNSGLWTVQREFFGNKQPDGSSYHIFQMNGSTVEVVSSTIGGSSYSGTITFSAKTEPVSV